MRLFKASLSLCILSASFQALAFSVDNQKDLVNAYGMGMYPRAPQWLATTKVAVLDNGFSGFEAGSTALPPSAALIAGPKNPLSPTNHGFGMAVISWALTQNSPDGPQYYLVNANGYSNFKAAVDFVIDHNINIVIYSQNWLYGSNFDGSGLFGALIKKATDHGVIWLQAAGNYRNEVYNQNVLPLNTATGYVPLPDAGDTLRFENLLDDNDVNLVLSWNDFGADENYASAKDLDLYVYNDNGTEVGKSQLQQQGKIPPDGTTTLSALARESLTLKLKRGNYVVKVKANSNNFVGTDKLRLIVTGGQPQSIVLHHASSDDELAAPADSKDVITVGDCSELSSRGAGGKPDVVLPMSLAQLSTGEPTIGSSNAAAMLAGIVSVLRATELTLDGTKLRSYISTLKPDARAKNSCTTSPVWRTPSPQELHRLISQ